MAGHHCPGPIGIAGGESLDEFAMFVGGAGELGSGIAGGGAPDDGLLDKGGDHGGEAGGAGGGDDDIVEAAVLAEEGGDIRGVCGNGGGYAIVGGAQMVECSAFDAGGGAAGGMGFKHGAQREHFGEVVAVPISDKDPLAVGSDEIEFGFEAAQGFSNWCARDTTDIGKLGLGELRAGGRVA